MNTPSIVEVEGQHIQYQRDQAEAQAEADANKRVTDALLVLLAKKNAGYGRNLQRHGVKGITIRLADKLMRLENQVLGANPDYVYEPVTETLQDIAGYAIKALALLSLGDLTLDGEWRGQKLPRPHAFVVHPWEPSGEAKRYFDRLKAEYPPSNTAPCDVEVTSTTAANWAADFDAAKEWGAES